MTGPLLEPLAYAFFVRALAAGVLVGAMCGALSVFVVLRRMSYIGHGLSHAVLGGVAVGVGLGVGDAALGVDLYAGALAATLVAAVLIEWVARRRGLHADAAIGIVTTTIFAVGVAVLSVVPTRVNLEALLFGNLLGVRATDLWVAGAVGLVLLSALVVGYKRLVFALFDPEVAEVHGVPVARAGLALSLLTALVVVASVRVLGVLLIAAAVVIPGATARLLASSLGRLLAIATGLGAVASIVGLYVSFHVDVPSGPAIVLTGALCFAVAAVGTGAAARGRLARARLEATR